MIGKADMSGEMDAELSKADQFVKPN